MPDDAGDLARLAIPVLVVTGTDPEHPRRVADGYLRAPNATLAETTDWAAAIAGWLAASG